MSRTNPNNISKRDVKHFCFQHFLTMPRTILVYWHIIDVIALLMMEICLTLIRVDSGSRQQIPSYVKGTNYCGKAKLRNLFGKLFWDIYFIVWKGSWFWLFTHFGAIKSPWLRLPFHTIKYISQNNLPNKFLNLVLPQ